MAITLDLTSTIRSPPMLPVDLIGASKGSYLIGASKGLYLWVNPSEAPRLAPVHLRHVDNPHFYTYAQLPHHTCQRSSTTHNCRERKRRATLEEMVILTTSGCLSVVTVATYLYVRIVMYRLFNHTIILLRSRSNVNNDIFSYSSNAH